MKPGPLASMNHCAPQPDYKDKTMTKNRNVRNICAQVVLASLALTAAGSALACHSYDIPCKMRDAANKAKQAAEDAANRAKQVAEANAAAAKAAADKAAAEAAAAAAAAQQVAQAEATRVAAATVVLKQVNNIAPQLRSAYSTTHGAVVTGYRQAGAAVKAAETAVLDALFVAAAKSAVSQKSAMLGKMSHGLAGLDAAGNQALGRIISAIAAKRLDETARADMQLLATKLGVLNPGGVMSQSSFGIELGTSAADIVGADESYGIVMNTFLVNGKFQVGLTQSMNMSVGAQEGASAGVSLYWGPGPMGSSPSVGITLGADAGLGADISASWGISRGMSGAQNAIPGMAVAVGVGGEARLAVTGGYSNLLATF